MAKQKKPYERDRVTFNDDAKQIQKNKVYKAYDRFDIDRQEFICKKRSSHEGSLKEQGLLIGDVITDVK